jgi:hypothetical protein
VFYELLGGTRLVVVEELIEMRRAHSAAHFRVEDMGATVRELRARGVEFDEFDLPRLKTVDGLPRSATTGSRGSETRTRTCWRFTNEPFC